ncbi:MAG: hotdog fold thioesterase [Caldilineales bacterium]|nr:hotdog fold thioesterase [Caldilineales bacterium]
MPSPDPTALAVARFMQEHDAFGRLVGIELLEIRPGFSRVRLQLGPQLLNGLGMPHGGAIFTLADFAFAAAGNSHGQVAVALSMDIHFLRSPRPDALLLAEAVEVRKGRRTALYRITVADESGEPVAELHGMAYRREERLQVGS